jgi:hypothetical protein
MTPSAYALKEGLNPLSGGGWKAPQYGYWLTYLAVEVLSMRSCNEHQISYTCLRYL